VFEDDGGISSDEEDDVNFDDEDEDERDNNHLQAHGHTNTNDADLAAPRLSRLLIPPSHIHDRPEAGPSSRSPGTARPSPNVETATPTPTTPTTSGRSKLPRLFPRRPALATRPSYEVGKALPVAAAAAAQLATAAIDVPTLNVAPAFVPHGSTPASTSTSTSTTTPPSAPPMVPPLIVTECGHRRSVSAGAIPTLSSSKMKFSKVSWTSNKSAGYNFSAANDIVGIVMLEIKSATDLPKLKNSEWVCSLRHAWNNTCAVQ